MTAIHGTGFCCLGPRHRDNSGTCYYVIVTKPLKCSRASVGARNPPQTINMLCRRLEKQSRHHANTGGVTHFLEGSAALSVIASLPLPENTAGSKRSCSWEKERLYWASVDLLESLGAPVGFGGHLKSLVLGVKHQVRS